MAKPDLTKEQLDTLSGELDFLIRTKEETIAEMTKAYNKTGEAYWLIRVAEFQEYIAKLKDILKQLTETEHVR